VQTSTLSSTALETGIAALEQQHYAIAIGLLEAFCHDCAVKAELDSRDYFRAQMHLIAVYEQQGQLDRAITFCRNLLNCPNAQVQIWANQKLTHLMQFQANMAVNAETLGTDLGATDLGTTASGSDLASQPEAVVADSPLNWLKRLFQSVG